MAVSFLSFIVIVILTRIFLPPFILKEVNNKLEHGNDVVAAHIDDLSISLWRGSYSFEGVKVWPQGKSPQRPFATAEVLQFSISWPQLLHWQILSDAEIKKMEVILSPVFLHTFETGDQKSKVSEKDKSIPAKMVHPLILIDVNRVVLNDCKISIQNVSGYDKRQALLTGIQGDLTNISNQQSSQKKVPSTLIVKGQFFNKAPLRIDGRYIPARDKAGVSLQARGIPLVETNPFLVSYVPLNFASGTLDIWSEATMDGADYRGYAKPFFRKVKVFRRDEKFVSTKHFFDDAVTALGNLLLRDGGAKTTAAIVEFTKSNGKLDIKTGEALKTALKNGFVEPLQPGFEPKYFSASAGMKL